MRYLVMFILALLFWLLITFSLDVYNILVGAVAALLTVLFFGRFYVRNIKKFVQPQRYFHLVVYLFIFIWECIKANFDVAYRVLHPKMLIKPGIVKVKLNVQSGIARTILANSITMTPGTISVDIVGDYLYVHWIYVQTENPEEYSRIVAGRFEKYIKKIFE
ncbi:MAG TPA: Na+/H+ antiporter subunit E [Salinivirga sp.]|uniref:Na+/H+ antiporter subunit E n=1 Tax=Salinivirga sp. TaxID=1970192 RepID=UPI002B47645A|nr:Na+/H+ antiporter subunit E [Salinivirga sp.]HKK58780.1 Na+/H+ antiporter subunit E [Salinivirga sp.]